MLITLVFFTYLDVSARHSISDLRLSWDRRTILIGKGPHLAMIPSPGEVSIRMNIIFTHMNHLKQLSQYEWFVSRTETPYRKCRKLWTRFPSSEMRKRVVQVWELRDFKPVPLQKAAQTGHFTLVYLKCPSAVPDGESQGRSSFRPNTALAPASDNCRRTVTLRYCVSKHLCT